MDDENVKRLGFDDLPKSLGKYTSDNVYKITPNQGLSCLYCMQCRGTLRPDILDWILNGPKGNNFWCNQCKTSFTEKENKETKV